MNQDQNQENSSQKNLALLPLKGVVLLPKSIIPIIVGRQSSILAVEHALKHDNMLFVTAQKDSETENPTVNDVFDYGTRSLILQVMRMPKGMLKILVEGICRSHLIQTIETEPFILTQTQDVVSEDQTLNTELEATWRELQKLYATYAQLNQKVPADLLGAAHTFEDIDAATDTVAGHITHSIEDRQVIVRTVDLKTRILALCTFISKEIDILQTEERIRSQVQKQVEKNQREYYLNEQIKAIQKELGRDDYQAEIGGVAEHVQKLDLPADIRERINKEIHRLEQMSPMSPEASVSRTYIDWLISLPWSKMSKDSVSLKRAEEILNQYHAQLKKPKERIIEYLAAQKYAQTLERSPILCLVGPPGVGKTSLAESIAKSLGRKFVRISLGGVRDEAEIRGHRRTYVGAQPGKIIQAIKKAGTKNPVILLDEIDKMAHDLHGDPASALLEVLDPEQNKSFTDHYIEAEFDLSKVLFITTANMIDGIPYPLFDRMEIIRLSGYTNDEKLVIAQNFLIPRVLKEYSVKKTQLKLAPEIVQLIINEYTKEAGVRQLERVLAKLTRKAIQLFLENPKIKSVTVDEKLMREWLGRSTVRPTSLEQAESNRIGLAIGLAWTELGGDILEIEVTTLPGKGNLLLTGQLGEVMQESAQAALSYVRSRAQEFGLKDNFHTSKDIHIHLPEGATPKDGPSAGITMCTALVSSLTKIPVKPHLAMTGEITLRGRVLAIGGLKEKLLAARQNNITLVILPLENENDMLDIAAEIGEQPARIFVKHMDEVLVHALECSPFIHTTVEKKACTTKTKKNNKQKKAR
ncbi:MAG: Lon protease [candidate division TM6 bacterium GW2011_GWE2_41_16]|nr:MAG: Lon protease [candidate division TM6 bacterium GW2011_GWE2_41_16]